MVHVDDTQMLHHPRGMHVALDTGDDVIKVGLCNGGVECVRRPSPVQVLSLGRCPLRANVGGRSVSPARCAEPLFGVSPSELIQYLDRQLTPVTNG